MEGRKSIYIPDIEVDSPMNQLLDQFPIVEMDCKVEERLTLFIHCCEQPGKFWKRLEGREYAKEGRLRKR